MIFKEDRVGVVESAVLAIMDRCGCGARYKCTPSLPVLLWRSGVAAVGLFSLLYNIPRWMESTLVRVTINNGTATYNDLRRTELGNSFVYQLVYFDTLYYIFMFILPLVLLTIFNTRLIMVYRRFRRKRVALRGVTGSSTG